MALVNFYTPDSSLFEADKFGKLSAKREQKAARILDTPPPEPADGHRGTSLLEALALAKSSAVSEVGTSGDIIGEVGNFLGGDNNVTAEDGLSNRLNSDAYVGSAPVVRENLDAGVKNVYTSLAKDDYGQAISDAYDIALPLAADSMGSFFAGAAGAVGTGLAASAVGGPLAGIGAFGTRINKGLGSIFEALDDYQKVKKGVQATGKIAGKVAKTAVQSSVLVANDLEKQVQEYRTENNGENPSGQRLSGMVFGSFAVLTAQVGMFKHIYTPKGKPQLDAINAVVKSLAPTKSNAAKVGSSIVSGAGKVLAAGGAEAVQEYVQQWQQILSKKTDTSKGLSLLDAVLVQLKDSGNQLDTQVAGLLGASAGGAVRVGSVTPGIVGTAALSTTKGTYNTISETLGGLNNRSARKKLSETDKRELYNQQANDKVLADQTVTSLKEQSDTIASATTVKELRANPELAQAIDSFQGKTARSPIKPGSGETDEAFRKRVVDLDKAQKAEIANSVFSDSALEDSNTFKGFKKVLTASNKKAQVTITDSVKKTNIAHFNRRSGKPRESNIAPPSKADVDNLVARVTPHGEEVAKAAGELETALALDTIKQLTTDNTVVSKRGLFQAKELSNHDLERVAAIVSQTNPAAAAKLAKLGKAKTKAFDRFSPNSSKIIDSSNVPKELLEIAKTGIPNSVLIPRISQILSSTIHRTIKGQEAVDALRGTISHYENSDTFKTQGKGTIHPATLVKWKKRLDKAEIKAIEAKANEDKDAETKTEDADTKNEKGSNTVDSRTTEETSTKDSKETTGPKDFDEDVEPEVTTRTGSGTAHSFLTAVSKDIDNGDTGQSVEAIQLAVDMLKRNGYSTTEDFTSILNQYPSIKKDPATHNKFILETYNPEEEPDSMATKNLSEKQAKEAYDEIYPGCRK